MKLQYHPKVNVGRKSSKTEYMKYMTSTRLQMNDTHETAIQASQLAPNDRAA